MSEKLETPIIFFDLETTGLNLSEDKIIEIYMMKVFDLETKIKPEIFEYVLDPFPVKIENSDIHGITQEEVEGKPRFKDIGDELLDFIDGCAFSGYNIEKFDLPFLLSEFLRAGADHQFKNKFNPSKHLVYDSYQIWTNQEPRTLAGAAKYYLNKENFQGHRASTDTKIQYEIFKQQLYQYNIEPGKLLHEELKGDKLDFEGKFKKDENGNICLTFGKYKDVPFSEVNEKDPNYLDWMIYKSDMSPGTKYYTKALIRAVNKNLV